MSLYLDHFGLATPPFRITPHPGFFFRGGQRGAILDALNYAIVHEEGIVLVSGEVGCGKTMLCRMLLENPPPDTDTLYIANPSLSADEMLLNIMAELGLADSNATPHGRRQIEQALLERHAAGRHVVLLIDEAHAMPGTTLEEIRLLANLETRCAKLLQIVLFAQPEIDTLLQTPAMRPLRERITQRFTLPPLAGNEVSAYLEFRLRAAGYRGPNPFTPAAARRIARVSLGLSRRINILADKALLAAYAGGRHQVAGTEVRSAQSDACFTPLSPRRFPLRSRHVLAGLLVALLFMAGLHLYRLEPPFTASAAPLPAMAPPPPATSAASAPPPERAPGRENAFQQHLNAFSPWLSRAPHEAWFIQLFADRAENRLGAERALNEARQHLDPQELRAYRSSLSGYARIGIVYGEYPSRAAAQSAIAALPKSLLALRPYPRQVNRLL